MDIRQPRRLPQVTFCMFNVPELALPAHPPVVVSAVAASRRSCNGGKWRT